MPLWAQLSSSQPVQAKQAAGGTDDLAEREADRVADVVAGADAEKNSVGLAGRSAAGTAATGPASGERDDDLVRRAVSGGGRVAPGWGQLVRGSRGGGRPLPEPDRGYMEGRFGADFSAVRLHDDARANSAAAAIGARAFTAGSDIVFGAGQYAAGTPHGRHLLAHELAHVVQQGSARSDGPVRREPGLQPVHISPVRGRPIQRQPQGVAQPAAMPGHSPLSYHTLPPDVQSICDEQAFNEWVADRKNGPGVRVTLIGIYRLMEKIGFNWKAADVNWVGTGNLLLEPGVPLEAFREHLLSIGFKDVWLAKGKQDIWGLRRIVGAVGLHVRAKRADKVEFHIDLHPPKWWALFGLWHLIMDKWARESTHTPAKLAEALHLEKEL